MSKKNNTTPFKSIKNEPVTEEQKRRMRRAVAAATVAKMPPYQPCQPLQIDINGDTHNFFGLTKREDIASRILSNIIPLQMGHGGIIQEDVLDTMVRTSMAASEKLLRAINVQREKDIQDVMHQIEAMEDAQANPSADTPTPTE